MLVSFKITGNHLYGLKDFKPGDCSQTLVRGARCKKGALKIFDPCKGALNKIPQILQ